MSLLMQALKKAERARQSGLPDDPPASEQDWGLAPLGEPLPPAAPAPAAVPPAPASSLTLEPLDVADTAAPRTPPPLEPATEAAHDPVPPQARHEPARGAARSAADPLPPVPPVSPEPGAGRAAAAARARAGAAAAAPRSVDLARLRIAVLSGLLVLIAAIFAYIYWQATSAPGPGARLPMVPMPPPSATGATGIAVVPSGPPFGPQGVPVQAEVPAAATPAPAAVAETTPPNSTAAAVAPPPAPVRAETPRSSARRTTPLTEAQLATIEDPAARREAERDALERASREATSGGSGAAPASLPAAATAAVDSAPAYSRGPAETGDVHIARGSNTPVVNPAVQQGYSAFVAGDLAGARAQYDAALRQDANSRDALLGNAAVALRENRGGDAAGAYARLLELNPDDADALAGLIALRPGDLGRSEAKLRGILRTRPDAAPVLFALGNLYARQNRWQEAQQSFFRAWTAAPTNPDYAFNLAVGLDRLNQGRLAADYYTRALALSGTAAAAFDRNAVQRRLQELAQAPTARTAPSAAAAAATAAPQPLRGD